MPQTVRSQAARLVPSTVYAVGDAFPTCLSSLRNVAPNHVANSHPLVSRSIQQSPSKDLKPPLKARSFNVRPIEFAWRIKCSTRNPKLILSAQDFGDHGSARALQIMGNLKPYRTVTMLLPNNSPCLAQSCALSSAKLIVRSS